MKAPRFLLLLLGLFCLLSISRSASSSSLSRESLGIHPEDAKYFKSDIIKCKDGSKKFTKAQLNDDFCDCPDGTDEPGTSACSRGKFYCRNTGHAPLFLFSSRVNDGICDFATLRFGFSGDWKEIVQICNDCCDGSDEYDGKVKCPNTCWEAGKVARDKLKKKITTYKEGVTIRKQEVEQAKQGISKNEAELSKLKSEEKILKGLVQQLKERKEQIEKAEEKERLEKEKEEKRKKESEEKADEQEKDSAERQHDKDHEKIGNLDEPSLEQDSSQVNDNDAVEAENGDNSGIEASHSHGAELHVEDDKKTMVETESSHDVESNTSPHEVVKQEKDGSDSTKGLSREELGRLVASRWTGENSEEQTKEVDDAKKEEHKGNSETQETEPDEDYDGYNSSEDNYKYDEDVAAEEEDIDDDFEENDHHDSDASYKSDSEDQTDFSDITTSSSSSWLDKIQQTVRNILLAVNLFQSPIDKSEAAHIRKEYDDASTKLSKIQSRISSLSQKLEHDYGPEKEFYSFYDRCFENKQNKYVYKVCPFKQASQVEGHSTTQLGRWEKFEDSYRTMLFSNGDKCWNGPDRSLKVKLRCGLDNELTDVDEPSRCEYVAILSTPALCLEEKLKELQHKLDLMNREQPQSHDEL